MKIPNTVLLCTFLAFATAIEARANSVYVWTGGAAGYAGTITLDSNSSAGGTLADIVSAQITTPQGTFIFDPETNFLTALFTWNPSQITNMWFEWSISANYAVFGENIAGAGLNLVGSQVTGVNATDESGSWMAASPAVPDAASTGLLFGLGLACLALLKFRKTALA